MYDLQNMLWITSGVIAMLVILHSSEAQEVSPTKKMNLIEEMANDVMSAMTNDQMQEMMDTSLTPRFHVDIPELPNTVDCFGLPSWIATPLRRLFSVRMPIGVNTRFYLKTRKSTNRTEIGLGKKFSLTGSGFDPKHRTIMIVHGFFSTGEEVWVHEMMDALLGKVDANVFAVDWSGHRSSWKYWRAVANTRVTGHDMTRFVESLLNAGMRTENLHLIGHSLGAHVCGFVSRNLKGVARITGLDPAQPCFRSSDPRMTLDYTDATFVDIIHTNGRTLRDIGLGLPYNIGHVDYYPNGGMTQPGCEHTSNAFLVGKLISRVQQSVCSHGRAYMIFTESIRRGRDCIFWGHLWDRAEDTMRSAMEAPCNGTSCSPMGLYTKLFPARGSFIVHTRDTTPYCVPEEDSDMEIKMAAMIDDNTIPNTV